MLDICTWSDGVVEGDWIPREMGGRSALVSPRKHAKARIDPHISGYYALFVRPYEDVYVDAGDGLIRLVPSGNGCDFGSHGAQVDGKNPIGPELSPVFVTAGDFTGRTIEFRSEDLAVSGLEVLLSDRRQLIGN